jgi:hypothetical protein
MVILIVCSSIAVLYFLFSLSLILFAFSWAFFLSPVDVSDLLRKCLVVDPAKRIRLKKIKRTLLVCCGFLFPPLVDFFS